MPNTLYNDAESIINNFYQSAENAATESTKSSDPAIQNALDNLRNKLKEQADEQKKAFLKISKEDQEYRQSIAKAWAFKRALMPSIAVPKEIDIPKAEDCPGAVLNKLEENFNKSLAALQQQQEKERNALNNLLTDFANKVEKEGNERLNLSVFIAQQQEALKKAQQQQLDKLCESYKKHQDAILNRFDNVTNDILALKANLYKGGETNQEAKEIEEKIANIITEPGLDGDFSRPKILQEIDNQSDFVYSDKTTTHKDGKTPLKFSIKMKANNHGGVDVTIIFDNPTKDITFAKRVDAWVKGIIKAGPKSKYDLTMVQLSFRTEKEGADAILELAKSIWQQNPEATIDSGYLPPAHKKIFDEMCTKKYEYYQATRKQYGLENMERPEEKSFKASTPKAGATTLEPLLQRDRERQGKSRKPIVAEQEEQEAPEKDTPPGIKFS